MTKSGKLRKASETPSFRQWFNDSTERQVADYALTDWMAAARSSIRQPLSVSLPFREAGYFAATEARAVGYAIKLRDGQRLSVTAETNGSDGAPLTIFLDLYRQTGDTANPLDLVASTDTAARLVHEARRDGVYVLRVQPELLRSGDYNVTASTEPSLAFPVSGRDGRAVKSFFGADRDAGARRHLHSEPHLA